MVLPPTGSSCLFFSALFAAVPRLSTSRWSKETPGNSLQRCYQIPYYHGTGGGDNDFYVVVTKCPAESQSLWKERCEGEPSDAIDIIPVTDTSTKVTYKNVFCSYCNGRAHVTRWQLKLRCSQAVKSEGSTNQAVPNFSSECFDFLIIPPSSASLLGLGSCQQSSSTTDDLVRRAAASEPVVKGSNLDHDLAGRLGYAALFNFGFDGHFNLLLTDDHSSRAMCSGTDQLYNPFEMKCVRIRCPSDFMSVNGQCVPRATALGKIIQSQAGCDSNASGMSSSSSSSSGLKRTICMDVRLPPDAADAVAAAEEAFEKQFKLDMTKALRTSRTSTVNVTLLTPVLSPHGHCKSRSAIMRELFASEKEKKRLLDLPLDGPQTQQPIFPKHKDEHGQASIVDPEFITAASSSRKDSTPGPLQDNSPGQVGAITPIPFTITPPDDVRRSERIPRYAPPGELETASSISTHPDVSFSSIWRRSNANEKGTTDTALLFMNQNQACEASRPLTDESACNNSIGCMVSIKITFHLRKTSSIFNFLLKNWQTPFVRLFNNNTDGNQMCIDDLLHDEQTNWCTGITSEYFNDEFQLLWSNATDIIGIRVDASKRVYGVGQFHYMVDLDRTYWTSKNVSQMAVVCDPMPKITDTHCPRMILRPTEYELLPNHSIKVKYPAEDVTLPSLPSYKELFNTDEYEYVLNEAEGNHTSDNDTDISDIYFLQMCLPLDLFDEYVALILKDKTKPANTCSFMDTFSRASAVAGLACTAISLVAMTITFVTYAMFQSLRTLAGASIMNLTAAQIVAQLTFLLGSYANPAEDECVSLAVLAHYFLLSSFCWTNVMAYINYKSFGSGLRVRLVQRPSSARPLLWYAGYAYGMPALVCSVCVALNFSVSRELIGYGNARSTSLIPMTINGTEQSLSVEYTGMGCWISNPMATLVSFGAPLVYCLLVNIVLFLRTVYGMRAYQKDSSSSRRNSGASEGKGTTMASAGLPTGGSAGGGGGSVILRRDSGAAGRRRDPTQLSIQVRLSVLYGFSWVFGIVIAVIGTNKNQDSHLTETMCYVVHVLSFVFNLLNGSMGTFLFFAFTFNRRILQLYKSKFTRHIQNPPLQSAYRQRYSASQLTISSLLASSCDLAKMAK